MLRQRAALCHGRRMDKTMAQYTQEYVEADQALMAFVMGTADSGGETRHVDLAQFTQLEAARDVAHEAYVKAWHDPTVT